MTTLFHLSEILKFAIEKEQESQALYVHLAQATTNEKLKKTFTELAQAEKQHEKLYEQMMHTTEKWSSTQDTAEFDDYMRELIASSRTSVATPSLADMHAALNYALAREKDSILFYAGLANYVPPKDRENIHAIIREEVKHATILNKLF